MLNLVTECKDTQARLKYRREVLIKLLQEIASEETRLALLLYQIELLVIEERNK